MLHILRRTFSRKFFIRAAFCVVALFAMIVVAYCVEKWRGQRAWEAYSQAAAQRGVKLWPEEYAQPEIPDAENYAAVPWIREVEKSPTEKRTRAPGFPDVGDVRDYNRLDSFRFGFKSTPTSMEEVRDFFVRKKVLTNPSTNAAKDVVELLAEQAPGLQQLREATSRRFCRFSTNWGTGTEQDRKLVGFLQNAATLFQVSSSARLALGDVAGAADEIRHLRRLSEAMRTEPGLVASMIGAWTLDYVACAITEGIITGQWTDADLRQFDEELAAYDPVADLRFGLNSERAFVNVYYERYAQHGYFNPIPNTKVPLMAKVGMALYPTGWMRHNMVKTNEHYDFLIEQLTLPKENGQLRRPEKLGRDGWSRQNFGNSALSRAYWSLARSTVYLLGDIEVCCDGAHSHLALTRLAIGLERCRRAKNGYPETLAALVPEFLPTLPQPLLEGRQIFYRRNEGGYVLWEATKEQGEATVDTSEKGLKDVERVLRISSQYRRAN